MTRLLFAAIAVTALAAGCSNGGAQEAGPVPSGQGSQPSTSTGQLTQSTTTNQTTSTVSSTPAPPLCADRTAAVRIATQEGAAGTISTVWRVRNTSSGSCRSFGYPGMDFHAQSGWLDVQVHRGGFPNIDKPATQVILAPGQSLFFVSYWNDVDSNTGPCRPFDRVKVTLPDNFTPAKLASTGCLNPESVDVGPVTTSRPS
jgi:hypothetical protein